MLGSGLNLHEAKGRRRVCSKVSPRYAEMLSSKAYARYALFT
jgi:hypothetical protein